MSHEIERRVLGAYFIIGNPADIAVQQSMLILNADHFYHPNHKNLFLIIKKFFYAKEWFHGLKIIEFIKNDEFETCTEIISQYYSANSLLADANYLVETHKKMLISNRLKKLQYEFDNELVPHDACLIATEGCHEISKMGMAESNYVFTAEMMAEKYNFEQTTKEQVVPTGIKTLDSLNDGGFVKGSLITIAGRSGMGKTGFAVHLAHNLAVNHHHHHVLFYSLEMTEDKICEKQLTSILGKHPKNLTQKEKVNAIAALLKTQFTIDRKPMASIDYIETSSKIIHIKNPISVIVVDYIGLVQNKSKLETHALKQADISLRLAALALELDCIVIALTQVNRDYAGREDKCPITSDAADSSGSERSSGYWLGIYRPEVDNPHENGFKNQFHVKCRKNRFGNIWSAVFNFSEATFQEVNQNTVWTPSPPLKGLNARKSAIENTMQNYSQK